MHCSQQLASFFSFSSLLPVKMCDDESPRRALLVPTVWQGAELSASYEGETPRRDQRIRRAPATGGKRLRLLSASEGDVKLILINVENREEALGPLPSLPPWN